MKEAIPFLNDLNKSTQHQNSSTEVLTTHQKHFNTSTTHLILDFEKVFDKIDLKTKLVIVLAAVNSCKIIRYTYGTALNLNQINTQTNYLS